MVELGEVLFGLGVIFLVFSFVPVFPDPYHEFSLSVDFWTFLKRELVEVVEGFER